jgi:hypothetical protein
VPVLTYVCLCLRVCVCVWCCSPFIPCHSRSFCSFFLLLFVCLFASSSPFSSRRKAAILCLRTHPPLALSIFFRFTLRCCVFCDMYNFLFTPPPTTHFHATYTHIRQFTYFIVLIVLFFGILQPFCSAFTRNV